MYILIKLHGYNWYNIFANFFKQIQIRAQLLESLFPIFLSLFFYVLIY